MSKFLSALKGLTVLAALTMVTHLAVAQAAPAATPTETAPLVQQTVAPTKPIVINWTLHKLDGKVNLVVNPDGTWIFSGGFKDKKKEDDWDITLALKSSLGAVYLFHYEGNAADGVQFSKQGDSALLKDDYSTFAHSGWSGVYSFHLSKEGREAKYKAFEEKRAKLEKELAEAKKKKDEKLAAEKKAEAKKQAQEYAQEQAQAAAQAKSSGGSSGSSVINTIGSVVSSVGSAIGDVLSFF